MKKFILLIIICCLTSCDAIRDNNIKNIIEKSNFSLSYKIEDVDVLDDDLFCLAIHYSLLEEHIEPDTESDYYLVRYIFKTKTGVYRMFYLVDYSQDVIALKSSEYEEFYKALVIKIFGEEYINNSGDGFRGDLTFELMAY